MVIPTHLNAFQGLLKDDICWVYCWRSLELYRPSRNIHK